MNTANLAFHSLQQVAKSVERFTVPLAADFFAWCRETNTFPQIRWSLSVYGIIVEPADPLADLKSGIERKITIEKRRSPSHWSFDLNRRIALDQMMSAVEKFERECA